MDPLSTIRLNEERVTSAQTTTNLDEQWRMSRDSDVVVRTFLASNRLLLTEIQRVLAQDPEGSVRGSLAGNRSLLPEIQRILVQDAEESVRGRLARNRGAILEVQRRLVMDPESMVRTDLALSDGLFPEVAASLVMDPNDTVLLCLLDNPQLQLNHRLPVPFLARTGRGQEYLERELTGLDSRARAALAPTWAGTLEELIAAVKSFA